MKLYIITNDEIGKFYIGVTESIERRIIEHNSENSNYTGTQKGVWRLVFVKEYQSKQEALKEEKRLKKAKNKKYLQWYIENQGP